MAAFEEFFASLIGALSVASPKYSAGTPTWIMSRKTHMDIVAKALTFNAAGALVAGMQNTMPVIGGEIIELDFVGDYTIIGGYLDLYLLAERAGAAISSSEHVRFTDDQTVFKGTARYDGKPIRGEAFVAVRYDNTAPTTSAEFATDSANADSGS